LIAILAAASGLHDLLLCNLSATSATFFNFSANVLLILRKDSSSSFSIPTNLFCAWDVDQFAESGLQSLGVRFYYESDVAEMKDFELNAVRTAQGVFACAPVVGVTENGFASP
jgi:hypothetical protein